jgi:ribonuclease III
MRRVVRAPDAELGRRLGWTFRDPSLLETALTHPSAAFERDGSRGNERLEFLGDAVLDLVVAELLFEEHPDWREGELTRARAALVNATSLAARARELGLADYLVLGRTEERSGGEEKERILANLFEAVLGALYLEGGLAPVAALVRRAFAGALASREEVLRRDPKTLFQEWAHATLRETPRYRTLEDSGVEEAEDRFRVSVEVAGTCFGAGTGRTKRAAERAAAREALLRASREEEAGG